VAQLLDIFGYLSVLLRGLSFAFEALTVGGVIFVLAIGRGSLGGDARRNTLRWLGYAAILLTITQACVMALNAAILTGTTDLRLADVTGAGFWLAGCFGMAGGLAIATLKATRWLSTAAPFGLVSIMIAALMTSHSVGRLEHRVFLVTSTLIHHLAGDAWIGGLPYLLVTLRHTQSCLSSAITARFSRLALASVGLSLGAGACIAWNYIGSGAALVGTTYGAMLLAKVVLTGTLLLLGLLNWNIARSIRKGAEPNFLPLRRFAEAEIGIGFTILLAAASLTSTPPATDVVGDRVSVREIVERMEPRWPRLSTPSVSALSPATPLNVPPASNLPGSFVPGQSRHPVRPADIAWSEYNHHWAGLVVLAIGFLALLSPAFPWARHWPFAFLGLAIFVFVRADSENWPLGPRGFWESFQVAEVAQHRFFVLLIIAFAIFEWAVQTNRLSPRRAGLVFPMACALGGALLLTHSHSLGNVKEEFLAELSHLPLSIFAVVAGWSRWLELRVPAMRVNVLGRLWPACFVLIGAILLSYRES